MKLLEMNPAKFFVDMHSMLPATLQDIESEIYALLFQDIWFKAIKSGVHVYSEFCTLN